MLKLTKGAVIAMLRWAEQNPSVEVTGFVAESLTGQRVQPMRNVSPYPDRYYDWDPAEMMERYTEMDALGEAPICIYHSHPAGSPSPSETDMQGALNVSMHYAIMYPEDGVWRLSVWECVDMGILLQSDYEVLP